MLLSYTAPSGATRILGSRPRTMNATGAGPIGASAGNGSSWFVLKPLMALVGVVNCRTKRVTRTDMKIIREARGLGARSLLLLFRSRGTTCVNEPSRRLFPPLLRNFKDLGFIALFSQLRRCIH